MVPESLPCVSGSFHWLPTVFGVSCVLANFVLLWQTTYTGQKFISAYGHLAMPLWACGGILHGRGSEVVAVRMWGGEAFLLHCCWERQSEKGSQTGTQTHTDTQTHTWRRNTRLLFSLTRAHAHWTNLLLLRLRLPKPLPSPLVPQACD